ncbi:MAG: 4-hydroxythreonine-4-phosphate dehydrogenase PdxA [Bacteroidota bacterium]|nr:4-hydroxythreonine-4-phosphate dehydrogenase PdxA [Bacteroidota bacterium]
MSNIITDKKPVIGFSCGDINGIGPELIIKSLSDNRILDFCIPIVFTSNKVINFYRKSIPEINFSFSNIKDFNKINPRQVNIFNCWEEEIVITPGELNETGGKYAVISLEIATQALKDGHIDAMITAPLHKKNVYSNEFPFTGHTPFLKAFFDAKDVLMLLTAGDFRVGLVTEHLPVKDITSHISRESILSKLTILHSSLKRDFNIDNPKIGVLALNPHAGDDGLLGTEEEEIIKPAIKEAKQHNMLVTGPFSADAFFARGLQTRFDAVLAMYHDQGLIPFKSLSQSDGINFTAGLKFIRTSPDHGTAFDISGKNKADPSSFRAAIFGAIDILNTKRLYDENRKNPMKKLGASVVAGSVDEKILE